MGPEECPYLKSALGLPAVLQRSSGTRAAEREAAAREPSEGALEEYDPLSPQDHLVNPLAYPILFGG